MAMAQEVQLREIGTSGRVCRVLLVEDNLADARLTRELMVEAGGFEVRWASRLAPALESLAREPFDVVLLDLLLPDGIGMEVVERVRAAAPETPVVVLSGLGEDDLALARRAVLRGAQDYLPKSALDGNLLKRTVSTAIERARLENALRRREAQLEEAQALARMGDWWWRPGDRTISLSAQLMRLIGRDPARFTAGLRGVLRVLEPPARPVLLQAVRRLLEGETSRELRLAVRRPDGGRRIFRVELRRREAGGLYGVCQDVTEQQLVERMKNEFVSVVSHELRTPLTSLLGALRLLRGLHEDGFDPRTRELLDIATRNGDRLKLLVDDLLDLERIESGALAFEPRRVELGGFLRELLHQHESYAAEFGVRLSADLPPGGALCRTDPGRLAQAVGNLLSNAVKFSPPGETVRVSLRPRDRHWRIAVADRGPGIPPEFRPRLFEKFAQADSSDRRRGQGTGLGLAIVKAIVERLGGACGFESEPGRGATFHIDLPRKAGNHGTKGREP